MDPHPRLSSLEKGPGYTINFDNVSIVEFIRFVSRIGDINFIYPEEELNFKVTIVSEEPTDLSNIMAALVQVLRLNGFNLIDDGQNLLIHPAGEAGGLATVVSPEIPFMGDKPPPIVTRVFKLRNGNPQKIAALIKPMLSPGVMLEVSQSSRHLIVTDLTANVDKIADLLVSLDAPQMPLEMDSYTAKNGDVNDMVKLATEILTPLGEGNPLILVPQEQTHTIFIVSTPFLIEKALTVFEDLDAPGIHAKKLGGSNIYLYQLQYRPASAVLKSLHQIADNFKSMGYGSTSMAQTVDNAKYIRATNAILFTGSADDIAKLKEIISTIDTQDKTAMSNYFLFKPKYRTVEQLSKSLHQISKDMNTAGTPDESLIYSIEEMKVIPQAHAILFMGSDEVITHLKTLLESIDVPTEQEEVKLNKKFLIYKLKTASEDQMEKSLHNLAETLEHSGGNEELIHTIDSLKYIKSSNSLVFTGTANAVKRLNEILPTFDTAEVAASKEFYLYTPKNRTGEELLESVHHVEKNLKSSGLADPAFLQTLDSAKWMQHSKALVFTGDQQSLARVHELMETIDVPDVAADERSSVFIYKIIYIEPKRLEKALDNLADNLPSGSDLKNLIDSMKYAQESNSLVFKGTAKAIKRLKDILASIDTKSQAEVEQSETATYELIKLKNVSGGIVIKDLHKMAKNLEATGSANPDLLRSIKSIEWIKSTNSLYIPGTPETLKKIKGLVEQFDVVRQDDATSNFYVYKPQFLTGPEIIHSLHDMAADLKDSGLSDAQVLTTIEQAKYVPSSDTVVFTGSPDTLKKIKDLLATIDNSDAIKGSGLGKTTFLIYKIKHVPGKQLLSHIRSVRTDLDEGSGADEKALAKALSTGRYVPETNSLIFTGPTKVLARIDALLKKFDDASLAPKHEERTPETYVLYQPKYVKGPELIHVMNDFEQNLKNSGVDDAELYEAISTMKWMPKTSSILISGSPGALKRVEELLARFDTASTSGDHESPTIDNVDDISFLIYKLQYHSGTEIESALRKIAYDMAQAKTGDRNQDLINAIQSVQWIETTNSLVGSGTPKTLLKLRDLIKGIDVPLKQVFIEVLVIETDINNTLELGLRWGSQGKYRNKLAWGGGAFPRFDAGTTDPAISFNNELGSVTAANPPEGTKIPLVSGFGLGVIGDIIFHKGQSYAALGSFLDAIRTDGDVTVILSQKIITQDNKQATLFVGDNIPFNASTVINNALSNANTVQTANIEYRDVGVSLTITPRVGQDDMVTIVVDEEISEQSNTGQSSGGSNQVVALTGIQTSKTNAQTQVTMPNNYFLVLTGSMRTTKTRNRQSIPCLGALPVVGALFQHNQTLTENKNVVIFIKPQIIKTFDVYKKITEHQEDLYRSQAVAEDFDEGLEYVVTPDDDEPDS